MIRKILPLFLLFALISCEEKVTEKEVVRQVTESIEPAAYSLDGKAFFAADASDKLLKKAAVHQANYEKDSNADNLIWHGRFIAYQGKYKEAISLFTKGIVHFPGDARMYRHRGHRYISIRKFDEAINDFKKAVQLIQGRENEIEPDGIPNAQNIPVSTLHGNIYYHLGLAYYLKHDFPSALDAYQKCLATSNNPDNVVSATHWLYMIHRRMDQTESAQKVLDKIATEMPVIENMAYHQANLLYKGELQATDLWINQKGSGSSNDALDYGIANWYFYNGDQRKAKEILSAILERDSWSSFGYIAAEKDYFTYFK